MVIKIIYRKDRIYDVYDKSTGKWLFSRGAANNVFSELSKMRPSVVIEFEDESIILEV